MSIIKICERDIINLFQITNQMIYAQDLTGDQDFYLENTKCILNQSEEKIREALNTYCDQNNCSLIEAASSLYVDPESRGLLKKEFFNLFKIGNWNLVIKIKPLDEKGRQRWIRVTFYIQTNKGVASKLLGLFEDVTEFKYEMISLEEATRRDLFTGLFNKTNAFKLINRKIETSLKSKKGAFAILDIDNFKHFNDFYGHDVGDLVLETVAKSLNSNISDTDIVGRFGGDEFIIFIENFENEEKLKKDLEKFLSYQVGMHEVKASIGISILNKDATTFNRLFKHADEALYVAKKSKEKIAFYDPNMR